MKEVLTKVENEREKANEELNRVYSQLMESTQQAEALTSEKTEFLQILEMKSNFIDRISDKNSLVGQFAA